MEADWEVEIGDGAPVIDASWPGRIDLQQSPQRVAEISETREIPALAPALVRLNAPHTSPVWTSKSDVWSVEAVDPDELDAPHDAAQVAVACYIDLLARDGQEWDVPAKAVAFCEALCARMHAIPLCSCRVDLIVRSAFFASDSRAFGITAYLTACGASGEAASAALSAALCALADALLPSPAMPASSSQLQ